MDEVKCPKRSVPTNHGGPQRVEQPILGAERQDSRQHVLQHRHRLLQRGHAQKASTDAISIVIEGYKEGRLVALIVVQAEVARGFTGRNLLTSRFELWWNSVSLRSLTYLLATAGE